MTDTFFPDWVVTLTGTVGTLAPDYSINVRYKENLNYEVQVECKIDDNKELYQGIENQLINKYFSSGVQYGIYLIFYFGRVNNRGQKDIEEMKIRLKESIPTNYNSSIKVICINLDNRVVR